ncbi:uncharacterized protein STEHIDRAFT_27866, partial [Stereum hirsutum FP-91666 SS1]|uniref:uncharacterized protein n=1 Tax=Stereum hirsutum (strain FP-91666) TaxID=721885 RepID=UPI000440C142
ACYDNSTSNLWDHVNAKHPELPVNQGTVTNFARGSTYTPEKLRLYEVFWCCSSSRPFSIVTDEWLLKIFSMFHPGFKDWSEQTISRDTHEIFKIGQKNITKATPGRKHIAFDGWSSANALTFIGLNLYMIYNGELCSILLDYVP